MIICDYHSKGWLGYGEGTFMTSKVGQHRRRKPTYQEHTTCIVQAITQTTLLSDQQSVHCAVLWRGGVYDMHVQITVNTLCCAVVELGVEFSLSLPACGTGTTCV